MAASEGLFIAIAQSDSFSIAVTWRRHRAPSISQKVQTRLTRQRRRGPLSIQLPLADPHYGKLQEPHARIDTPRTNPAHKAMTRPLPRAPHNRPHQTLQEVSRITVSLLHQALVLDLQLDLLVLDGVVHDRLLQPVLAVEARARVDEDRARLGAAGEGRPVQLRRDGGRRVSLANK